MLIPKDVLYKYFFYSYFLLLPIVAVMEAFSSGSNKIFNGIFLLIFLIATIDLHYRSLIDKYIFLFFCFAISIFLANSLVYGLDISSELVPDMAEGFKVGTRVLLLALISYFTFLMVRFEVLRTKDFIYIATFLVISMIVSQLSGQSETNVVMGVGNEFALQGLTGHIAISASILVSVLPFLLITSNKSKISLIALFLCCVAVVFTFRRSAWLIFLILGLIHLYMTYFRNNANIYRQVKVMGFMLVGVIATGLLVTLNQDISDAIMARLDDLNVAQGGTGAGRSIFWGIILDYSADQPLVNFLFGNGFEFVKQLLESQYGIAIGAHNDWLDFFLAFGILPLILLAAMVAVLSSYLFQSNRVYRQLLAYCLISFIVLSMTTGGVFDTYFAFLHASIGFALASQENVIKPLNA